MVKIRMIIISFVLTWALIIAAGRIGWIATGEEYLQAARGQSEYTLTVDYPRGTVFDRKGIPLTNTQGEYAAVLTPTPSVVTAVQQMENNSSLLQQLTQHSPFVARFSQYFTASGATLIHCYAPLQEVQPAVHLIGYTDAAGKEGVAGLQLSYDQLLGGSSPSTVRVTVGGNGGALSGVAPVVAHDTSRYSAGVVTTLECSIQQMIEQLFPSGKKGCILVSRAGELVGCASFPTFSPAHLEEAINQSDSPLLNRPFSSYNVGSVFKLTVAAAALEKGISPSRTYTCTGSIRQGVTFGCHEREGHGQLTMEEAMAQSCNTYFIDLAREIGGQAVADMAAALGFGQSQTLCQGMTTQTGNLPEIEELLRSPAALGNFAIGQGELMATPLQVHTVTGAIMNGGELQLPRLILGTVDTGGNVTRQDPGATQRVFSQTTAQALQQMMRRCVTQGTGQNGCSPLAETGGKTATAQTGMVTQQGEEVNQAWFTGYAKVGGDTYVITVLVEEGTGGSTDAAPLFRAVCEGLVAMAG